MKKITKLNEDYLASNIRCQVSTLESVLDNIANYQSYEEEYIEESLKRVESDLRKLRMFFNN